MGDRASLTHFAKALGAIDAVRSGGARGRDAVDGFEIWDADGGAAIARALAVRDDVRALEALGTRDVASARRAANARDDDGWNAVHYAVHYGHLRALRALVCACAGALDDGARATTPLDVASRHAYESAFNDAAAVFDDDVDAATTFYLYSWGSGVNFTLGTGSTDTSRACARVETLASADIRHAATSKFHALAVDRAGAVWSWGCARRGVLALANRHARRGDETSAVIFPTRLDGARAFGVGVRIASVSTGAAHSAAVAITGEVFTWGSGRHGRLGYVVVDSSSVDVKTTDDEDDEDEDEDVVQFAPKRVPHVGDVAKVSCGDEHTVFLDRHGDVWTVGSNARGQLGYFVADRANDGAKCGAPDVVCSSTPKRVEYLKHRNISIVDVSASHAHTVVASNTQKGDVYSWGHGSTTVRRVNFPKDDDVAWHSVDRRVVRVSAGQAHSAAITRDGWLLVWASAASDRLDAVYVRVPGGAGAVDVSCGAARCVVASALGDAYEWDAAEHAGVSDAAVKRNAFAAHASSPSPSRISKSPSFGETSMMGVAAAHPTRVELKRVPGLKGAKRVFAGDAHFLALQGVMKPVFSLGRLDVKPKAQKSVEPALEALMQVFAPSETPIALLRDGDADDDKNMSDDESDDDESDVVDDQAEFPSLRLIAQDAVARAFIEPRNVMSIIQLAGDLNCEALKRYAMTYVVENMDIILSETPVSTFAAIDDEHLDTLTALLRARMRTWSERALRTRRREVENVEDIQRAAMIGRRFKPEKRRVVAEQTVSPPLPPAHLSSRSSGGKPPRGDSTQKPTTSTRLTFTPKSKGSLSMFLSGDLENKANSGATSSWNTPTAVATSDDVNALVTQTRQQLSLAAIQEQQLADSAQLQRAQSPRADAPPPVFSPSPVSLNAVSLGALIRRNSGKRGGGGSTSASAWKMSEARNAGAESMSEILAREAAARDAEATHAITTGFNVSSSSADGHRWYVPDGAHAPAGVSLRDIQRVEAERLELEDALRAIEAQETAEALALIAASTASTTATRSSSSRRRKPSAKKSKPTSTPATPATSAQPATPKKTSRHRGRRAPRNATPTATTTPT